MIRHINFGKLFYRDYYEGVDWRSLSEANSKKFQEKNEDFLETVGEINVLENIELRTHAQVYATTYPGLFIGSGYQHETGNEGEHKLGFFFDHTIGLPVIPGSSIKGKLRSVFPQFNDVTKTKRLTFKAEPGSINQSKCDYVASLLQDLGIAVPTDAELKNQFIHRLELSIFDGIDIESTILRQNEPNKEKEIVRHNTYKVDLFFDAFISKSAQDQKIFETDFITPHTKGPLKNPIPLQFLRVKAGVEFTFSYRFNDVKIDGVMIKADIKKELFRKILEEHGIGAKTNVGYGNLKYIRSIKKEIIIETFDGSTLEANKVYEMYATVIGPHKKHTHKLQLKLSINGIEVENTKITVEPTEQLPLSSIKDTLVKVKVRYIKPGFVFESFL